MTKYTWLKNNVPDNLTVKQEYGMVFFNDGRVLLRIEDNRNKLTGGKPELNETFEETLKREYVEELNVELEECYYLGYLLVEENNEKDDAIYIANSKYNFSKLNQNEEIL